MVGSEEHLGRTDGGYGFRGHGFELSDKSDSAEPPRHAFLGVRPCDLRTIAIQDRVLAQPVSRVCGAPRARLLTDLSAG